MDIESIIQGLEEIAAQGEFKDRDTAWCGTCEKWVKTSGDTYCQECEKVVDDGSNEARYEEIALQLLVEIQEIG